MPGLLKIDKSEIDQIGRHQYRTRSDHVDFIATRLADIRYICFTIKHIGDQNKKADSHAYYERKKNPRQLRRRTTRHRRQGHTPELIM